MSTPATERTRWGLVIAAGLAVFMAQLDTLVVGVALPTIAEQLGTRPALAQWVVLGYLLPYIALTLPSGRWLDRVGTRAALMFSITGFALASAAAALAPGIGALIAARVLQGSFAAVLLALMPALATAAARPAALGRAQGAVTTLGALGAVTGPVLGGLMMQTIGWRGVFVLNLPVALLVACIGLITLAPGEPLRRPTASWASETVLLGVAAGSVLLGLSLAARHGVGWAALALLAIPAVLAWSRTRASVPVRRLLTTPGMLGAHLALTAAYAGFIVAVFLVPFYLQRTHTSATVIGLTLLTLPLAQALCGPIAGALADRQGPRRVATVGTLVLTAGLGLLVPLGATWPPLDLGWRLAVVGVGAGLFVSAIMAATMAAAPVPQRATAGATTNLARQLGIALGPALATTSWAMSGYSLDGMQIAFGLATAAGALAVLALAGRVDPLARGTGGEQVHEHSPGFVADQRR